MTKKSLLAMTLMLSAVVSLHAQDMSIPMTWAVQNHDVRSQAMGGTTSLSNQFGMSGIGNPASIVFFDYSLTSQRIGSKQSGNKENFFTIGGTAGWHYFKPGNTHYAYAGATTRIAIVGVSASYIAGWAPNWPWSSASPCHQQVNIGVGVRVLPYLSLGANVKYFSENTDASAKLFAGDIFAMADYSGLRATLGVRNLSGSFTRGEASYRMPYSYVVGLGIKQDLIKVLAFEVNGEYELYNYGGNYVHRAGVGAHLRFLGFLSVSGGYNWGGNSPLPTYGSIGLGVGIVKIIELEACYMFNRNNSLNMIGAQLSVKF
ncbi:MAG: hypothetical protein IJR34_03285 [Bacteroidales bacterium]|nr:hypothetical protein [Bacteroidales bacterium]